MNNDVKDVIAFGNLLPDVALVAIRRGWLGDNWITRDSVSSPWVYRGANVTDAQKKRLAEVYEHAKKACDLREKCINWHKAHPESDAEGYTYPEDVVHDLRSIDFEQGLADGALENLLADGSLLLEIRAAEQKLRRRCDRFNREQSRQRRW